MNHNVLDFNPIPTGNIERKYDYFYMPYNNQFSYNTTTAFLCNHNKSGKWVTVKDFILNEHDQ